MMPSHQIPPRVAKTLNKKNPLRLNNGLLFLLQRDPVAYAFPILVLIQFLPQLLYLRKS